MENYLQPQGVEGSDGLDFLVLGQISHRAYFNVIPSEREIKSGFRCVGSSLPGNRMSILIIKFHHRLPVQPNLSAFGEYGEQQD